jgi:hypothetical protein
VDEEREKNSDKAVSKGLPTDKEKLEELKKEGLWTEEKEKRFEEITNFVSRLRETKSKIALKSEAKRIQDEIDTAEKEYDELNREKTGLIGMTSEMFADKKANDYYIFLALYKDKEFKEHFFSEAEYDELSDKQLTAVILAFNRMSKRFNQINLKRIALSGFFLNNFYLCKENPFIFFGKPIVDLTFHQTDLFAYGRYFKHILSEMKSSPPQDVMEDPDKLLDQYNLEQNKDKVLNPTGKDGAATTIVGATKEDLEALGLRPQSEDGEVIDLHKAAKEKGGELSMEDLMKLHGH